MRLYYYQHCKYLIGLTHNLCSYNKYLHPKGRISVTVGNNIIGCCSPRTHSYSKDVILKRNMTVKLVIENSYQR